MADVSITAANVVQGSGPTLVNNFLIGETITAGQAVYLKTSDNRWWKAQADGTAEESGVGTQLGIALNGGAAGQPVVVQTAGTITIGGTVAATTEYVVSATAGGICPKADLVSTNKYTRLGYGTTSAILAINPLATGVAVP